MDDLESRVISTIDSLACKNDTEHAEINRQLSQFGGGGIGANENKIKPNYYHGSAMADYVANFDLNFDLGCVVKYVSRAGKKHGELVIEDLRKAQWYLQHAIDVIENKALSMQRPEWEE